MKDVMKMLDTICLELPRRHFKVTDPKRFQPDIWRIESSRAAFLQSFNNPTKAELQAGLYGPRMTYNKRGATYTLTVEFSAPKLVFGNNVEELSDDDLGHVIQELLKAMTRMGVSVPQRVLAGAKVLRFHPSKNIVLSSGFSSSLVVGDMAKVDINKALDITKMSYREGGNSLQFYSQKHSLVIYDKVAEMSRPKNRQLDLEPDFKQLSLFEYRDKGMLPRELLRFEVRFTDRTTIKKYLERLELEASIDLQGVFSSDVCQKIVELHWNDCFRSSPFVFEATQNPLVILQKIMLSGAATRAKDATALLGVIMATKDDGGIRGYRAFMESQSQNYNWQREKRKLKKYEALLDDTDLKGYVKQIECQIDKFEPLRLGGSMK